MSTRNSLVLIGVVTASIVLAKVFSESGNDQERVTMSPPMLGMPSFREFVVASAEVLVAARPGSYAVKKFKFALPEGVSLGIDTHHGEVIKIKHKEDAKKAKSYCVTTDKDHPGSFDVIVKVYDDRDGVSAGLGRLKVGDKALMAHRGRGNTKMRKFIAPSTGYIGAISYGIGITKIVPVLREELKLPTLKKAVLLWANRSPLDLAMDDEVAQLVEEHGPHRLEVRHIFSREQGPPGSLSGRIDTDVLRKVFADFDPLDSRFLVVGDKAMIKKTYAELEGVGFSQQFYSGEASVPL